MSTVAVDTATLAHAHHQFPVFESHNDDFLKDPQLAAAMREGTKEAHKAAENSVFTKRFIKGEINRNEYGRYITSLYFVYDTLERLLEKNKDTPAIKAIYFPYELMRSKALLKDLEYYYGKDKLAQVIDPSTMTPAVKEYVNAMEQACEMEPALLVAHSYSRYLGDLSGGQILAKRLKKHVLGLSETDGEWDSDQGLAFYAFNNIGNQNAFKNEYRERLDTVLVTQKTRDLIVKEAIRSFELNIGVFDEIQELSEQGKLIPTLIQGSKDNGSQRPNRSLSSSSSFFVSALAISIFTAYYYTRMHK